MEKRANFVAGVVLSALMLLVPVFSYAQNWTVIDPNSPVNSTIDLVYSDQAMSLVQFRLNAYSITPVNTGNGTAYVVEAPDCTPILESGAPDLPKYTQSIIIPDQGGSSLQITSSAYIELNNIDIAPSKGNLTRDIDPASVPYMYGKLYSVDGFFPVNSGMLKEPYILRDFRGQTLVLHPFQYNPVTKTLRIYTEIKAMISYNNNSGINELTRIKSPEINDDFGHIYARHFLNYESAKTKYTALSEGAPGNMLIICYDNYLSAMQPFVDWKRRKGIETEIVGVSTVGTTSSAIKTYVANYYNTNGLVYLLIVGDDPQVTSSSTSAGDSDVDYGYIAGSDHYAEIFVGRFSAQTIAEVQTQVSRTIEYEKTPVIGDWWTNAIGIGSDQGPGDDNEMDYEHIRNIMTDLLGFTYSNDFEFYDGSQGGNDASGNPTPSMVGTAVNGGASTIFYCGHGSDDQFVTSGFSSTDVNNLTNNNKYPFIISVACVNGNFTGGTCFAEAWLRATNAGQPSGAVATFMSTINQSWDPPMCGEDEMADILVESYATNIKRTFGGVTFNGCFKMNDEYSDFNMTDTWTIFGDPSVMLRTASPILMTVTHAPTITLGVTSFTVNCDFNDALVSLTRNNAGQVEILGTGYIAGGTVDITIPGFTAPDTMFVTVTAFNHITYSGEVLVIASSGPYVIYNSKVIHDPTGNNNGLADYNEDITFDITLENVGVNLATSVTAVISTTNPDVTITDNTDNFGDIAAGTTSTVTDAYAVSIADGIADQTSVLFSLTATDGAANSWPSQFTVICNAPDLGQTYINVNDAAGNGDGLLDPGETLDINVNAVNSGHAPSVAANCVLTCSSPYVTINTTNISLGAIGVGGSAQSSHNVTIDAGTPTGTSIDFTFTVTAGAYSDVFTVSLPVGLMVEDWESNSFLSYAWENISSPPWFITTTNPYEGTYCSQSGNLNGNAGQSILIIDLDVIAADNVSFYKKVSCEEMSYGWYWDFLEFDIDNTLKGQWAGEVAWSYEEYPVTTGNHELKWIYEKDAWYDMGSDCAWLDYIVLPPHSSSTVITGTTGNPGNLSLEVFPNPVSTSSTISLSIDNEATVSILIFNVLGDKTMSIMEKKMLPEGSYSLPFDASGLANGIYTCRMIAGEKVVNKKFIIVK